MDQENDKNGTLSREELTSIVRSQRDLIEDLEERVERLEQTLSDVEGQVSRTDEIVEQLNEGSIGGEAGADLLMELAAPPGDTMTEALARQIYRKIIVDYRVGDWIKTSQIKKWIDREHNTQAHRAMEELQDLCDNGVLLGEIEIGKRRGQRAIRMTGSKDE